jgi:hypothetical protein
MPPDVTPDEFNAECARQLEKAKFAERIAVIGSGPSTAFIAPLASLVKDLETHCGVAKQADEYFWNYCSRACAANEPAYYGVIAKSYGSPSHLESRAYQHLIAINFPSYVTFNYDDQLPNAFRQKHGANFQQLFSVYPPRNGQTTAALADLLGHKQRLVAVHGYCDPQNVDWAHQIILKTEDYDRHYASAETGSFLFNWWKNLLTVRPCVFMGTSLQEPGLSHVVAYLDRDKNPQVRELDHIHLKDCRPSDQGQYPPPEQSLGVFRQILFDRVDDRFMGLLRVLSHFSHIATENPSPGMPVPNSITQLDKFPF